MYSIVTLLCILASFVSFSLECGSDLLRECNPLTQVPYSTCGNRSLKQPRCPPLFGFKTITGKGDDTCICKEGLLWKDDYKCVRLEECCFGNRTAIKDRRTCEDQCPTYPPVPTCERIPDRKHTCHCTEGYFLNYDNQCVLPEDCERCGPNEYYYGCLNVCEQTCLTKNEIQHCPDICRGRGCACKPGYVRSVSGYCISAEECPSCGENETYMPQACEETCDGPVYECSYTEGCTCLPGYVRDAYGKCIRQEDCPVCPANEIFSTCPTACEKTCLNLAANISCVASCLAPACVCREGYARNFNGDCIPVQECPTCGKNERFVENPDVCPRTCDLYDNSCLVRMPALAQGCECIPGYVRDVNRICIPLEDCPKCGEHEVYGIFHPEAELDSDNDEIDRNYLISGCVCEPGYIRDYVGFCVPHVSPEEINDDASCETCGVTVDQTAELAVIAEVEEGVKLECESGYMQIGDRCVPYENKKPKRERFLSKLIKKLKPSIFSRE